MNVMNGKEDGMSDNQYYEQERRGSGNIGREMEMNVADKNTASWPVAMMRTTEDTNTTHETKVEVKDQAAFIAFVLVNHTHS